MKNDKGHSCFQKCKLNQLVIFLQVICGTNILVKLLLWKWTYVFLLFLFSIGIYLLYITNTLFQQHKRRLYKWTSPDGQQQNHLCFFCINEEDILFLSLKYFSLLEIERLIEFCQENALVITNTLFQQHKRRLYTWTSPDGQH